MIDIQNMLAAVEFTPMTDIPFLTNSLSGDVGGATEMFNALFKLSITIGAMLAVFMFIFGGLQMITARDSAGSVGKGKDKMTNAVMGLLMLISTYVVLSTINPQLTSLTLFKDADGKDISRLRAAPRDETYSEKLKDSVRDAETQTGEKYTDLYGKQMYCKKAGYLGVSYDCYSDSEYCKSLNGNQECRGESRGLTGGKYTYHKDTSSDEIIAQYKNKNHQLYCAKGTVNCYTEYNACMTKFGASNCGAKTTKSQDVPYSDGEWHIQKTGTTEPLGYITHGLCEAVAKKQSTVITSKCIRAK